jgi:hypothetical protein
VGGLQAFGFVEVAVPVKNKDSTIHKANKMASRFLGFVWGLLHSNSKPSMRRTIWRVTQVENMADCGSESLALCLYLITCRSLISHHLHVPLSHHLHVACISSLARRLCLIICTSLVSHRLHVASISSLARLLYLITCTSFYLITCTSLVSHHWHVACISSLARRLYLITCTSLV